MIDYTDEELIALWEGCRTEFDSIRKRLRAFASALRQQDLARMARMREALRPFAECAAQIDGSEDDEEWAKFRLIVKEYREAAEALSETADIQAWLDGQRAEILNELMERINHTTLIPSTAFQQVMAIIVSMATKTVAREKPRENVIGCAAMNCTYPGDCDECHHAVYDADAPSARSTKGEG